MSGALAELIAALESAKSGHADLERDIFMALPAADRPRGGTVPRWTRSIDSALTLVPESMDWSIVRRTRHPYRGIFPYEAVVWDVRQQGFAHGPALALCIAALRARETQP